LKKAQYSAAWLAGYLPLGDFAKSQVNWEKHTQTIDKIRVYTYVQSSAFAPALYLPSGSAFATRLGSYDVCVFCKKPVWQLE
jgi:hypothetical protein